MRNGCALRPRDLISSATLLVQSGKGKPSQVNLRRAVSTSYYALFHQLARSSADLLVGGAGATRSRHAWRQTYRALDHAAAKSACKNSQIIRQFPKEIEDFANAFAAMQEKRHSADYDPHEKYTKSEVISDINIADQAITDFESANTKDKRAFCAHVLFKRR